MSDDLPQLVPAVVMQVGATSLAVPLRDARRFVLVRKISPLPGAPRVVRGICVVAGDPSVVVDLHELLGQPRRPCWPPNLGLWGEAKGNSLVLMGGQVRWVGRLRRSAGASEERLFSGALEWKGASLPLVSWAEVLAPS